MLVGIRGVRRESPAGEVGARSSNHRRSRPRPAPVRPGEPDQTLSPERLAEIEEALRAVEAETALPDEVVEAPPAPRRGGR